MTSSSRLRKAVLAVVGAGAGYAYYRFVGCTTGTCPITSNPYISTAYGALIGVILGLESMGRIKKKGDSGNS